MTISFSPLDVPKLPKGWLARLRTAVRAGAISESAAAAARNAGVNLQDLLARFVDPDGQFWLDPDDGGAAVGESFALGLRFPLLPYLVAFANSREDAPRHLCLTGDQGAGKTSVLAMLALVNGLEPHRKATPSKYLKLGRTTLNSISSLPDQSNTVLLLDSLDEDELSFGNTERRLAELVDATKGFRKVIITAASNTIPVVTNTRGGVAYVDLAVERLPFIAIAPFDEVEATRFLDRISPMAAAVRAAVLAEMSVLGSIAFRPLFLQDIRDVLPVSREDAGAYPLLDRIVHHRIGKVCEDSGWDKGDTVAELLASCTSVAVASWPQRGRQNETATADSAAVYGPLLKTGIVRLTDDRVEFSHEAFQAFFIARAIIEGTLHSPQVLLTHDVMTLLRSWFDRPVGVDGRHQLKWSQVRLRGARFDDWDLRRANFQAADLSGVDFTRADLSGADLRNACLSGVVGIGTDFSETICDAADFSDGALCESSFRGAVLNRASFVGAKLRGALFSNVSLRGVDFSRADLRHVEFRHVQYDASTRWPDGFIPSAPSL